MQIDDTFDSLSELEDKFDLENLNHIIVKGDTQITFIYLYVDGKPEIMYSLKLLADLIMRCGAEANL